jgi:signal peptidase
VVGKVLTIVAIAAWFLALRPQWLGGPALYVVVRGDSMVPTYANGDLLVIMDQESYARGEPAAYRVPAGDIGAGRIVVHRVLSADGGQYTMKGDNNPQPDPSTPTQRDMAGAVALRLPGLGALMAMLLSPTVAGGLAAALIVMYGVGRMLAQRESTGQAAANAGKGALA